METSTSTGRPRGFDRDGALDRALELFWRVGYEGASIAELTDAMGISRPSLYAVFGDKEGLFRAAVARYLTGPGAYLQPALEEPRAADAVAKLLIDAAAAFTSPDHPPGCLLAHGALACGDEGAVARDLLLAERLNRQAAIRARLDRGVAEGDLPQSLDTTLLAEHVMVVLNGMAVQALTGVRQEALVTVAGAALQGMGLDSPVDVAPKKPGRASSRSTGKTPKPAGVSGQLTMKF